MNDPQIDKQLSNTWRKDKYLTSEGKLHICCTRPRTPIKFLKKRRDRDSGKNPNCNNKCM